MRPHHDAILLALALAGCSIGPSPESFRPANEPAGISVTLQTTGGAKAAGELLEVRDTALVVLADSLVRIAPYAAIRSAQFQQRGGLDFGWGGTPGRRHRAELAQLARFPAGIPPGTMSLLLQLHGQAAPKVMQ